MPACASGLGSYLFEWVAATVYVNFPPEETGTFPFWNTIYRELNTGKMKQSLDNKQEKKLKSNAMAQQKS